MMNVGHFKFEHKELPKALVNLDRQGIEDYYGEEYEVEEFNKNSLVIAKEINGFCDNHFCLKLGENNIEVYKLSADGNLEKYEETEISKDYLPEEDIEKLEEGIYFFGEGKINAMLEDFE